MHSTRSHRTRLLAGSACLATLLALAPAAAGAADAPAPADRAALEQQLQAARAELDKAAREVAEISRQLYGGDSVGAMRYAHGGPPKGSMLGINVGGSKREEGVEVMGVSPGGPAEQAGIRTGDVIVAVDGRALRRNGERSARAQLIEYMRSVEPSSAVKVDYLRDTRRQTASVTTAPAEPPILRVIRERMAGPLAEGMPMPGLEGLLGPGRGFRSLELVAVTPRLGRYFGTDRGLLVVRVSEGKGLSLEEGDVLQSIDGRSPDSPGHAFRILQSYQPGEKVKLGVLRDRKQLVLEATVPAPDAARVGPERPRAPAPPAPPAPQRPQAGSV